METRSNARKGRKRLKILEGAKKSRFEISLYIKEKTIVSFYVPPSEKKNVNEPHHQCVPLAVVAFRDHRDLRWTYPQLVHEL